MKIGICGSMSHAQKMVEYKNKLEALGHVVAVACDIQDHLADTEFHSKLEANMKHAIDNNIIRTCFKTLVEQNDAILVLNFPKNGIDGYIGISTIMEMGIAFYLRKKIFTLFQYPHFSQYRPGHEIEIMQPVVINDDLTLIK